MYLRKSFQEKLAEIWKEVTQRRKNGEWVQSRLRWEDWETLGREAAAFAASELRRRRWRGKRSGVVPSGYDARGIASQAIAELLSGNCRLAAGFTHEAVNRELARLIRQKIRQLHRLAEAKSMRSEWDVLQGTEEGNAVSVFRWVVDEQAAGRAAAAEEAEERERVKREIEKKLAGESELMRVFDCLWAGMRNPAEIGRRLGMEREAVVRARKRLNRRLTGVAEKLKADGPSAKVQRPKPGH